MRKKDMPTWVKALILLSILAGVVLVAGRFSEKSFVFAEGSVSIAPELEEEARHLRNLFIVIYDLENPVAMPYGALRTQLSEPPVGSFHRFVLTPENLSVMAGKQVGTLRTLKIKARLTSAEFIGGQGAGDLVGEVSGVTVSSDNVNIVIDTKL